MRAPTDVNGFGRLEPANAHSQIVRFQASPKWMDLQNWVQKTGDSVDPETVDTATNKI